MAKQNANGARREAQIAADTCTEAAKIDADSVSIWKGSSKNFARFYLGTGMSAGSLERRHHFNSWLSSVISIPGMTINLQLNISRDSSSSGNWQETRQY
jgi:hypothetical protein